MIRPTYNFWRRGQFFFVALTQDRSKGRRGESSTQQQRCQTILLCSQRGVQAEAKRARGQRAGGGRAERELSGLAEQHNQWSVLCCVCVVCVVMSVLCGVCVCVVWSRRELSTQQQRECALFHPAGTRSKDSQKVAAALFPLSFSHILSLTLSPPPPSKCPTPALFLLAPVLSLCLLAVCHCWLSLPALWPATTNKHTKKSHSKKINLCASQPSLAQGQSSILTSPPSPSIQMCSSSPPRTCSRTHTNKFVRVSDTLLAVLSGQLAGVVVMMQ